MRASFAVNPLCFGTQFESGWADSTSNIEATTECKYSKCLLLEKSTVTQLEHISSYDPY